MPDVIVKNLADNPNTLGLSALLTALRKKETGLKEFRQLAKTIYESYILPEILEFLPKEKIEITTGNGTPYSGWNFAPCDLILIDIPRAGTYPTELIMENLLTLLPPKIMTQKGVVDVKRIERPGQELSHDIKRIVLPKKFNNPYIIITDPMLATGGSYEAVITELQKIMPQIAGIFLGSLISSSEGVAKVSKILKTATEKAVIVSADIDPTLDAKKYIVPGLGDAGDRLYLI